MRTSSTAIVALIGTTLLLVGCTGSTAPTAPSASSSIASTVSSAAPAPTAPAQARFKGALQGVDTDSNFNPPTVDVTTDGTGNGTHLGQFTFTQVVTLCFAGACAGTTRGTSTWTAANGDTLTTTIVGSGHPTDNPGEFSITDIHTITGGTGRFANSTGSFEVDRVASGITFLTSGTFDGSVTSPGAAN